MALDSRLQIEDVATVGSRISWGAVVAGSVIALAMYFLLILLGGAVGLSVSDKVAARSLGTGAAVYTIVVTVLCLGIGGCVASRFTVGENKPEGAAYGLLVWAVVLTMLMGLMANGVRAGFGAMVGLATAGQSVMGDASEWEAAALRAGVPQERIDALRQQAKDAQADARRAAEDPQVQKDAANAATRVAWYTFFGAWLSMMAAVLGGYIGAGPTLKLFAVPVLPNGPGRRDAVVRS